MLHTYIKLAIRSLFRRKGFSLINLLGLSLGMATALSIALYVSFELSYDDYHEDAGSIYRVIFDRTAEGETQEVTNIPSPVADQLLTIQQVRSVLRLVNIDYQNNSLIYSNQGARKTLEVDAIYYADSTLQQVLTVPLKSGSLAGFDKPHSLLLGAREATKLFGEADPVGQSITLSNNVGEHMYTVAGVFEDLPENTDFDFSVLLSMTSLPYTENEDVLTSYDYWQNLTYVRLNTGQGPDQVARLLTDKLDSEGGEISWSARLVPLQSMHFLPFGISEPGNLQYVRALTVIGILVMLIAWVNYINLATSRAMERSKEVGVRKVLGSARSQLTLQFIAESLVLNVTAALIAFTVVQATKPWLTTLANPMLLSPSQTTYFWGLLTAVLITGTLVSGSYPAFVMTSLTPSSILSGSYRHKLSGKFVRKGLVVFQFSISIFLLIGTLTVYRQIEFMRHKDLGMNIDNRIIINSPPGSLNRNNPDYHESLDGFRKEISDYALVKSISGASSIPGEAIKWGDSNIKRPGFSSDIIRMVSLIATDPNYFDTYSIGLLAGRTYREGDNTFGSGEIVINETAARHFGFDTPEEAIGGKLDGGNIFPELTIIGVTSNYHHTSLHDQYPPILYVLSVWANYYTVALNLPPGDEAAGKAINSSLSTIEKVWKKYFPEAPFDYFFADQSFDLQYRQDEQFGFMFGLFTLLAILLAILGLVGMVSYEVVQRSKEIGIRKVLGAGQADLVRMLTGKYILLVLVSGIVALPVGYWLFGEWLNEFAFRIQLSGGILILSFLTVMWMAMLVSATQVIMAARKNPVHSIKYE